MEDMSKEELVQKLGELMKKVDELSNKVDALTRKNEELTKKNEELTRKNEELTKKNEELTKKNEELTKKNEELTMKNEELITQMKRIVTETRSCDEVGADMLEAAREVFRRLKEGFSEKVYETAFAVELRQRGFVVHQSADVVMFYNEVPVGRVEVDLLVTPPGWARAIPVELKATIGITRKDRNQIERYMEITKASVGWLINFNEHLLTDSSKSFVYLGASAPDVEESLEL